MRMKRLMMRTTQGTININTTLETTKNSPTPKSISARKKEKAKIQQLTKAKEIL